MGEGDVAAERTVAATGAAGEPLDVYLPPDVRTLPIPEGEAIAAEFMLVRDRYVGKRAAPLWALPDTPVRVVEALEIRQQREQSLNPVRAQREFEDAILDLQAFVADEAAHAVEARHHGVSAAGQVTGRDLREIDRQTRALIVTRHSVVTSMLRGDINLLGNENALEDLDIRIGEARRSWEAVTRYRDEQAGGIASILIWPVLMSAGGLTAFVIGLGDLFGLVVSVVAGFGAAAVVAPYWGAGSGRLIGAMERWGLRQSLPAVRSAARFTAAVIWVLLLFVAPFVAGLAVAWLTGFLEPVFAYLDS